MCAPSRRDFLRSAAASGAALLAARTLAVDTPQADIQLGLVTYMWGADLDLPTLLDTCAKGKLLGVELRTTHKHGVDLPLSADQRKEVRKRFADSPVKLVGIGSAEEFHHPDPKKLAQAIENTKAYVKLSQDVGGTGVKVRPNNLPKEVPAEKTIEQIGKSLNTVAAFAADYNQQIRLEVHGQCAPLPIIRQILDVATHPNLGICWNSNGSDLTKPGQEPKKTKGGKGAPADARAVAEALAQNFNLVKDRLGATAHVKALEADYPFPQLMKLFLQANFRGWWLIEAGGKPPADRVKAFADCKARFDQMLAAARG